MAIDHAPGIGASSPETPKDKDAPENTGIASDGNGNSSTSFKGATAERPPEAHADYTSTTETSSASTLPESAGHRESLYRRFLKTKTGKFTVGVTAAAAAGIAGGATYHALTTPAPSPAAHGPAAPGHEHNPAAPDTYTHTYDVLFAPYLAPPEGTNLEQQDANSAKIAAISPEEAKKLPPNEAIVWGDCYTAALDGTKPGVLLANSMVNLEKIDPNTNTQDAASAFASVYQQNLYNAADQIAEHPDQENAIIQAYFPEAANKMHDTVDPLAKELRSTPLLEGTSGSGFLENMHGVKEGLGSTLKTEKLKDGSTLYSLTIGTIPKDGGYYGGDLEFDASQLTEKETVTFVEYPFSGNPTSPFEGLITLR